MYFVANMALVKLKKRAKKARVGVLEPTPTTAVDTVPSTPQDADSDAAFRNLAVSLALSGNWPSYPPSSPDASSDDSSEEVTGLVEHLRLSGAASNADAAGCGTVVGRAAALKQQGNAHFEAGAYHPALLLYSEAIEMLEGAGEDATLATLLCNRSVAHLKANRPGAALVDAERARALGAGKASFRLAEAFSKLGLLDEALEAYAAALGNAQERGGKGAVRGKIEGVTRGRVEVRATPADFAQKLLRAAGGTTLLLARGRYPKP